MRSDLLSLRPLHITEPLATTFMDKIDRDKLKEIAKIDSLKPVNSVRKCKELFTASYHSTEYTTFRKKSNYRTLFYFLAEHLKRYYVSIGLLENDYSKIKLGRYLLGRLKLLSYLFGDMTKHDNLYYYGMLNSILSDDTPAIRTYLTSFEEYENPIYIEHAIREICTRDGINKIENARILNIKNRKGRSEYELSVRKLLEAILYDDKERFEKTSIKILKLHKRKVSANRKWHDEICAPIGSLLFINLGIKYNKREATFLMDFKTSAIKNLAEFLKAPVEMKSIFDFQKEWIELANYLNQEILELQPEKILPKKSKHRVTGVFKLLFNSKKE